MSLQYPDLITDAVSAFHRETNTSTTLRQQFKSGKSGAFVALVDCEGAHDGVFILKVGRLPHDRDDEVVCHEAALRIGAFSGRMPAIVNSVKRDGRYVMLLRIAGRSRINWRPLVESPQLLQRAYSELARAVWTPSLFELGPIQTPQAVLSDFLTYRLSPKHGRIIRQVTQRFGAEFATASHVAHLDDVLPNPLAFAMTNGSTTDTIRILRGPVHGDCHSGNIFVKAQLDAGVSEISLIDLASFRAKSPFFFDQAYFEVATLLRQMDGLGELRWRNLVAALTEEDPTRIAGLEQSERAWAEDILAGRNEVYRLIADRYSDRADDLKLQFILAQVAAGLSFLNLRPREGTGSVGMSPAQYRQAFVWSAIALRHFIQATHLAILKARAGSQAWDFRRLSRRASAISNGAPSSVSTVRVSTFYWCQRLEGTPIAMSCSHFRSCRGTLL